MKKSSNQPNRLRKFFSTSVIVLISTLAACSSSGVSGGDPDPDPQPGPDPVPADTAEAVAPDGVLETVTWNIENYEGNRTTTDNAVIIVDSLRADLYALQEIGSKNALQMLTNRMKGYEGIIADYIEENYIPRLAFAYNTQTIEPIEYGPITDMQDEYDWAQRLPFYFEFIYSYNNTSVPVYAVVIHGKANTGDNEAEYTEAYQRRKRAAASLHQFLLETKPEANVVLLGDYNDDVDVSIYEENTTPYAPFVEDKDDFRVLSKALSDTGQSSTTGYPDTIDHITVSNEMEAYYVQNSVMAFVPTPAFISNYDGTTSDHYPVFAAFDIR